AGTAPARGVPPRPRGSPPRPGGPHPAPGVTPPPQGLPPRPRGYHPAPGVTTPPQGLPPLAIDGRPVGAHPGRDDQARPHGAPTGRPSLANAVCKFSAAGKGVVVLPTSTDAPRLTKERPP